MKTFTRYPLRVNLSLILKIVISALWLLCIASAARSAGVAGPTLGHDPTNQTICSGSAATFTVGTVTGTGSLIIRWQVSVNGGGSYTDIGSAVPYSGSTTATLTISNVSTTFNGNLYRLVVVDGNGVVTTSGAATLRVNASPTVSTTTHASTVCEGATGAGLQVDNDASLAYQWQLSTDNGTSWNNINPADGYTGSTTYDLTYPAATLAMNGYLYRYTATNTSTGCSTTSIALDTLHVLSKPVFASPGYPTPISSTICPGGNTSFTASPTGATTLAYQWQIKAVAAASWTDITNDAVYSGGQTNTLQITGFTPTSGNSYYVRLIASYPSTLGCASVTNTSLLSVRTLASVSLQPADVTVCANTDTAFKVSATGSAVLTYQWQTDNGTSGGTWSNVPGGTAARLPLTGVTASMNGYQYRVIVGNACSPPATSDAKTLTVRRSGTWLGTKDTKWEEPQNWCGGVPDNTIDVLVPNWPVNMPVISDGTGTAFFKSLAIENTARLTISGGTVNNMTGPYDLQGTVAYTAVVNQNVFPANHGSLEIDGSGNKVMGSNVDISKNLKLAGTAKLVTGTHILTMKNGSNPIITSAFTDPASSWIVTGNGNSGAANTGLGGVRIEQLDAADGAALFPVGPTPATYNPIQVTNAGTVDNYTVAVNDQVIPGGVYAAGINRTWLVSEAVPGGSSVTLSMKWQGAEEQSQFDRTQTEIIRSNGTYIVEQTAKAPASGTNPFARAGGSFTTLTQFSVASDVTILPVQLRSFSVQKTGNAGAGLTWKTDQQYSVKYFNVQRSADGAHFVNIGQVSGEARKINYGFTDNMPGSGTIYYRLQITGENDEVVFSAIQSLVLAGTNLAQLRPSATAATATTVYISLTQPSAVSVYLTDITGRVYSRQSMQLNKGERQIPLWIGGLNKGIYYVHVSDGKGNTNVLTLVKQ